MDGNTQRVGKKINTQIVLPPIVKAMLFAPPSPSNPKVGNGSRFRKYALISIMVAESREQSAKGSISLAVCCEELNMTALGY